MSARNSSSSLCRWLAIGCIYSLNRARLHDDHPGDRRAAFSRKGEVVMLGAMFGVRPRAPLLPLRSCALLVIGMVFGGLAAVAIELGVYRTLPCAAFR